MKKSLFTAIAVLFLAFGASAQHRADPQKLDNPKSFSMIMMGDPQNYVKNTFYQPIFELCTVWMTDHMEPLNIKAVLFTGDMVNRNDYVNPRSKTEDQSSRQMWEWCSHCLKRLDNKIPYIIAPGNHEYGYMYGDADFTHEPEYIYYERNSKWAECLVASFPNRQGVMSLENSAYEFKDKNWGKLLVLTLEWAPRDTVVQWARRLCSAEKYKKHFIILNVHSYLRPGHPATYTASKAPGHNQGKELWEKLVKPSHNIRLVLCGHTGRGKGENEFEQNVGFRSDKNDAGKTVHQMMFNCQFIGHYNGGDGWLRILEFMPNGKNIHVKTYSPLFGISPMTRQYAHRTASYDQFVMKFD